MIKSNSLIAVKGLHEYIMQNADFDNYGMEKPQTFKETAKLIMDIFYQEKIRFCGKKLYSYQETFCDWLRGLPSCIDCGFLYRESAVDVLGGILMESEAEKARYTESEAEEMLCRLIYREINKVVR